MKKAILAVIGAVTLSQSAQADIIKCNFTEPFIDTTYSMTQQTLIINNPVMEEREVIKNVSFQIKGAGKFALVDRNNKVIMELDLNGKGSDGMSDATYPYDVKWSWKKLNYALYGGCESNHLRAQVPQE